MVDMLAAEGQNGGIEPAWSMAMQTATFTTRWRPSVKRLCRHIVLAGLVLVGLSAVTPTVSAQLIRKRPQAATESSGPRDYTSPHFIIHSDMSAEEAEDLLKRLEVMLGLISKYWGRPLPGIIECYVVKDLSQWQGAKFDPHGLAQIQAGAGVTIAQVLSRGDKFLSKTVVYAVADRGTPQHEVVHAYCTHAFGRTGPTWYAEGMAEMGQYWRDGERAVTARQEVIQYLKNTPPVSLAELVAPNQTTGDSWQNYAWRWALCHLLANNPNYSEQFRPLGLGLLMDKNMSFEQTYGPVAKEISFEYLFFLKHFDTGYRVDLCAWNWKRKFTPLTTPSRKTTANVLADHGWQPSGLTVSSGTEYDYATKGTWKTAKDQDAVDADGADGAGKLLGVVMKDFELGEPFELGRAGSFTAESDGNLYLRCQDKWNELADNSGTVTVRFSLKK
jgi:hypothetical protein